MTEPSVSRMVGVLAGEGTAAGGRVVSEGGQLLEQRFAALVEAAGVSYSVYRESTVRLLAAIGGDVEPVTATTPERMRRRQPASVPRS